MTDYATKINALLAKADSTTSPAERDTFTQAAERLMVKWGVSDAMLEDATKRASRKVQQVEQRGYTVEGTSSHYIAELVNAVAARGIGPIRTFISRGRPVWWAVGLPDDLRRVEMYVPHLAPQARKAWQTWWRANGWDSTGGAEYERARSSFFSAYGRVVQDRFTVMFSEEVAETTGAELVLLDRKTRVDDFIAATMKVGVAKPRRNLEADSVLAGLRAGMDANLNAGSLGR